MLAAREPVGELWEDVARLTVAAITQTEADLARLRHKRRRLARLLVDAGYSRRHAARLLGVTGEGLRQMLLAGPR